MPDDTKPENNKLRPTPVYDRFFSEIVKSIQNEDGATAHEIFYRALNHAYEGKKDLGAW